MKNKTVGSFSVGYQIFRIVEIHESMTEEAKFPYAVIGPQDQEYHLMRVTGYEDMLLAMNMKTRAQPAALKGITFSVTESGIMAS